MIPVFEPSLGEEEITAVAEAVRRGEISGSFGKSLPEFEQKFAAYCDCKHGVAVSSGTTALHVAVAAAGMKPGDEILVSASTNIATALAAYHNGAVAVPIDSEDVTWNLDLDLVESLITPRTRAIIPVHLYGHPVDMDRVMEIARRHKLTVIEDCAEAHGATWKGRKAGSFGDLNCFSFYSNKIITTGEGGMIVTNDDKLAAEMRLLRNLAFTQPRFFHEKPGYNFRMTGMQAAMGIAQLAKIEQFIERKRWLANAYTQRLSKLRGLGLPAELPGARNVYWMYGVVLTTEFGIGRDELMQRLHGEGIETRTFFCPMSAQPFLKKQAGYREVPCPVADHLWQNGLYLPSGLNLTEVSVDLICERIADASGRR
jgi:perosamine synthetase